MQYFCIFLNGSNCDQNSEFYAILQSVYEMHRWAAPKEYKTLNENKRQRQGNTAKSKMDFSNSGRKTCDNSVKKVGSFKQNKQVRLDEEHSERQFTALCQRRNVYRGNVTWVTPTVLKLRLILAAIMENFCEFCGAWFRKQKQRQQESTVRCSIATW